MNTKSILIVFEVIAMFIAVSHAYPATPFEDQEHPLLVAGAPADLADSFGLTEENAEEEGTLRRQKRGWFPFGLAKGLFIGSALGYGASRVYERNNYGTTGSYRTYNTGSYGGNNGYGYINYSFNG